MTKIQPTFNLEPPPGFQGLNPDQPLTFYMRNLPHWRQDGASYFVTFRLADSLPQSKLRELELMRDEWKRRFSNPVSVDQIKTLSKEVMLRIEKWLDQGIGECRLRREDAQTEVANAMHYFDGDRCAWLLRHHAESCPCRRETVEAATASARENSSELETSNVSRIHKIDAVSDVGQATEALWQPESFDRIVRDEEHLYQIIQYIGRNPRLANLSPGESRLWLNGKHWDTPVMRTDVARSCTPIKNQTKRTRSTTPRYGDSDERNIPALPCQ